MITVTITGYVSKDCEFKHVKSKDKEVPVVNFTIAAMSRNKTIFKHCEAWGDVALTIADRAIKGARMIVIGDLKEDEYTRDGVKLTSSSIIVNQFEFLSPKPKTMFDDAPQIIKE